MTGNSLDLTEAVDVRADRNLTPWVRLREYTDARIALGRAGTSLTTRELLRSGQTHASTRDAVLAEGDFSGLQVPASLSVRSSV